VALSVVRRLSTGPLVTTSSSGARTARLYLAGKMLCLACFVPPEWQWRDRLWGHFADHRRSRCRLLFLRLTINKFRHESSFLPDTRARTLGLLTVLSFIRFPEEGDRLECPHGPIPRLENFGTATRAAHRSCFLDSLRYRDSKILHQPIRIVAIISGSLLAWWRRPRQSRLIFGWRPVSASALHPAERPPATRIRAAPKARVGLRGHTHMLSATETGCASRSPQYV
jgi:hypothetical protein